MQNLVKKLEKDAQTNDNILIDTVSNAKTGEHIKTIWDYDNKAVVTIAEDGQGGKKITKVSMDNTAQDRTKNRIEQRAADKTKRESEAQEMKLRNRYEEQKKAQENKEYEQWKKANA